MKMSAASQTTRRSRSTFLSNSTPLRSLLLIIAFLFAACCDELFAATNYTIVGWNNLGMHCLDSDFSVFSILPPYNTFHGQVIQIINGNTARLLTTTNGFIVTYEAVSDPFSSFNSTSAGKGNFWENSLSLFNAPLPVDVGLPVPGPDPFSMPGLANTPQRMGYESPFNWFMAYGVPIMPYDDTGKPNQYPMMRLRLKNNAGTSLATTDIVLPVSDEMDCKLCHLSGSGPAARPFAGWVNDPNPGRDYRLNILRVHDERQWNDNPELYSAALASNSYNAAGLYATVVTDNHPFVCATCHKSEALPIPPLLGIKPLTAAVHDHHASVIDPRNGMSLDAEANRVGCYTCHPGSVTRCLRGAMGKAVAADGSMAMQCQSCHGNMTAVGSIARTGWFDEPNCQACHVGLATNSYGVVRFSNAFDAPGHLRAPADQTFATNPDMPVTGVSLYRFSAGHGGLQCSACHGSTHAEYPSAFPNDNVQNQNLQGHAGVINECTACHGVQPANSQFRNGPHGMHPTSANWATSHADYARQSPGVSQCKACHGPTYQGSVLSRALGTRTVSTKFGSRTYWRGYQVSCYNCHDGVNSSNPTSRGFPTATSTSASTFASVSVAIPLTASTSNLRIVSQPAHGTVALSGTTATFYPELGYTGSDSFTFAASNGYNDSNLATVSLTIDPRDQDADGLPDWWEQNYFGSPTAAVAGLDSDGDGQSNEKEFVAKTNPLDRRYYTRIFSITRTNGDVRVWFTSNLEQKFTIERTDDLILGPWSDISGTVWGHTDAQTFNDVGGASPAQRFYRVRVLP